MRQIFDAGRSFIRKYLWFKIRLNASRVNVSDENSKIFRIFALHASSLIFYDI